MYALATMQITNHTLTDYLGVDFEFRTSQAHVWSVPSAADLQAMASCQEAGWSWDTGAAAGRGKRQYLLAMVELRGS